MTTRNDQAQAGNDVKKGGEAKDAGAKASGKSAPGFFVTPRRVSPGVQNIFETGALRKVDRFRIRAVATDSRFPFFVLSDSGLGYMWKVSFVNGKAWDENTRTKFLNLLEYSMKVESQEAIVNYTYSFTTVRRPLNPAELEEYTRDDNLPLTKERVKNLQNLAEKLEVQAVDLYFGLCASPSSVLKSSKISWLDRIKSIWDKRIEYQIESELLEDVVVQFGDKVKQILALFAGVGLRTILPMTELELLTMARRAWRPNYDQPTPTQDDKKAVDAVLRSLKNDAYISAGDFLTRDLRIEQYKSHWIADDCLNMLFSMDEAPDPNMLFSASEADRFLNFGVRQGVNNIPYLGSYTVAWSSMNREEGDLRFRYKNAFAQSLTTDKKGLFEDKMASKEAADVDRMHAEYIEGGSDMTRACVMYQLSIPLKHLPKFFETNFNSEETIRSISRTVVQQLNEIGFANWRVEDRTYYPCFMNSIPGAIRSVDGVQYLPRIYLSLKGSLHLVPFYATVGPENPHDKDAWRGSNYFISDESTVFIFDHFSKNNGTAANFSVCGATGSGKSVAVQSLTMMTEKLNPYIMILDFGGGNVGSWTKLCSTMGGVELKFGSARPPRINPFQLSEADSFPNTQKKRQIAIRLGLNPNDEDALLSIDAVYIYLRTDDSPFTENHIRHKDITDRCQACKRLSYEETMELLRLPPGSCRPGEKGSSSIKIVLQLLLSTDVNENGPTDSVWHQFQQDDINDAILQLYERYAPPKDKPERWPTLSDFRNMLETINDERLTGDKLRNKWGQDSIFNFATLMSRLSSFCAGGLDPFLDGQTNVDIRKKVMVNGTEKEMPAKFILADMAGIADKRKLALYMIVINDYMSNILYNSKESRGIMIRDEAWLFMKSAIANPYLEADYRLARKYGFSVITIAQQYSDFKSPVLQNNTQTWIVCSLTSLEEIDLAHQRFKFNDAERRLFEGRSMGTKMEKDVFSGKVMEVYSRIMIANQSGKYFVKNKIGKEERWITTTDADETFVFNFYRESSMRGRPPIEVIRWLCTDEYLKDEALATALQTAGRKMPRM